MKKLKLVALILIFVLLISGCRDTDTNSDIPSSKDEVSSSETAESSEESSVSSDNSSETSNPSDNGIKLRLSSPSSTTSYVTEPQFSFIGTYDPNEPLTVNGAEIEKDENGLLRYSPNLSYGKNTFTFSHKSESKTYIVHYTYATVLSHSPSGAQIYPSGSTVVITVNARKGSIVKALFNGETINLTQTSNDSGSFANYKGIIRLPSDNETDLKLGKITYQVTLSGKTQTLMSGEITCLKKSTDVTNNPDLIPTGGKYINTGVGYISEIIEYSAETFEGNVRDAALLSGELDWSNPTINYLPKGTVDYSNSSLLVWQTGGNSRTDYVTLRSGHRVYMQKKDTPRAGKKNVVKQYKGTLPDHNEISLSSLQNKNNHTTLTFDVLWKAPFYFELKDQNYINPSVQDFRVESVTYSYVDITFCYATKFPSEVKIPADNPLFKSAEIIENKNADGTKIRDYTLRLYLKKQGGFYGWDAYYNSKNQLCFDFLNPKTIKTANNEYGVNLNGAKILIDVGHGGVDCGATGYDYENYSEAKQNLILAKKLKAELEKIGANVYMTRTTDVISSADDKIQMLKTVKPDYCIAIHHNSSELGYPNGFGSYYFDAFSKNASELVFKSMKNTGNSIYKRQQQNYEPFTLKWHYYYVARTSTCPVVLTENGFISNKFDYLNIISDSQNTKKAKALTKGIVEYFKLIQ